MSGKSKKAILVLSLLSVAAAAGPAVANPDVARRSYRPENYADFVSVLDFTSVNEAVAKAERLYFPSRSKEGTNFTTYEIDNPIIVDRDRPLVMHGNTQIRMVPKDKNQPLLVIRKTPYFNMERFVVDYDGHPELTGNSGGAPLLNAVAFSFENQGPLQADFKLVRIRHASLDIKGPGTFVMQRFGSNMHGLLHAGVLVDHPAAAVYLISAGGGNRAEEPILKSEDIYWIWCKRGHLETYGCFPSGFTRGLADIRIDGPSFKGGHIIAFNRAEGTKRARGSELDPARERRAHEEGGAGDARTRLLYVPKSEDKIDIALKANGLGIQEPGCEMVDYNAAGTLWLLANHAKVGRALRAEAPADRKTWLARGNAPRATVVAVGNVKDNTSLLEEMNAGTKITFANIGVTRFIDDEELPDYMFLPETGNAEAMPPIPRSNPPFISAIPVGEEPGAALDLVSVKTFGAMGDGEADDTAALQAAFDSPSVTGLYFPAGVYRVTRPLILNISGRFRTGGWIAGAGAGKTRIVNSAGGTVVDASGVLWAMIQGIAFETVDQSNVCFHLDRIHDHTSGVAFDDCRFIGGRVAMGINMDRGPNAEHIFFNNCVFEGAYSGTSRTPIPGCYRTPVPEPAGHRFRDDAGQFLFGPE